MRAGKLNRKISVLQRNSTARSTDGGILNTWTTVLSDIWADVQPVTAQELYRQDVRWTGHTTKFLIRYSTKVNTQCKVVDQTGAEWDITGVIDVDDARRGMELLAKRST